MRKLFSRRSSKKKNSPQSTSEKSDSKNKLSIKQRVAASTAHWNFRKLTTFLVTAGLLVGVVSGWYWHQELYMNPERRFYTALSNSMSVDSVVRTLNEGGSGNQVTQQFRFHFAPQRVIENKITFVELSAVANTRVVTEGIIYPDRQFLRYTEFSTAASGEDASNIDNLLGQWAEDDSINEEEATLTYLSEQVSLVIFGNFTNQQRSEFMRTIRDQGIYNIDFATVVNNVVDDEQVLTYRGSVKLKEYATLLNQSFVKAGYGEFPPLDPENYREDAEVAVTFTVRKRDNVFVGVNFGGREESYSDYGVIKRIEQPEAVRTLEELQAEVQRQLSI